MASFIDHNGKEHKVSADFDAQMRIEKLHNRSFANVLTLASDGSVPAIIHLIQGTVDDGKIDLEGVYWIKNHEENIVKFFEALEVAISDWGKSQPKVGVATSLDSGQVQDSAPKASERSQKRK